MTSATSRTRTKTPGDQVRSDSRAAGTPEVVAISPTEWRVTGNGDGNPLVGVIQLIGDTYEAMQAGTPLTRYYFSSLEDAAGYLGGVR